MDTFRVKEWVRDSLLLQRVYVNSAVCIGRWKARRGQNLDALRILFPAWRNALQVPFPQAGEKAVYEVLERTCFSEGEVVSPNRNALLKEFLQSEEATGIQEKFNRFPIAHRVRLRIPREDEDPERQGNLVLLKEYRRDTGEKGVIYLKYTESFLWFAALYDLEAIADQYVIVLEPSSSGYQDWKFLLYLGRGLDVIVLSPYPPDFEFIESLEANLVPIRLGAGDWVDPQIFQPQPKVHRKYDLAMVSAWHPIKRHELLFRTLSLRQDRGKPKLSVALVGYPLRWPRSKIEALIRKYGVEDQCIIFEDIPHPEVAEVVADAKAFVLLSRHEGANKSMYESMFCNTPVIVYRDHRGVNPDHVPPEVGVRFRDGELESAIEQVLREPERFEPRKWASANTGWPRATERLNNVLERLARQRNEPWTEDIVPKKNSPNLVYAEPGAYKTFATEYDRLRQFLRWS